MLVGVVVVLAGKLHCPNSLLPAAKTAPEAKSTSVWFPPATTLTISSSGSRRWNEEASSKMQGCGDETSSWWPMPSWPDPLEPSEKSRTRGGGGGGGGGMSAC